MSNLEPIYLLPQEYMSFCNKESGNWNIKRCWLKKTRHLKFKEFSAFLCIGRCKSLGSLKSFLWHTAPLSGASIHTFWCWVPPQGVTAAVGYYMAGILFLSWIPSGLTFRAAVMWWLDSCSILCFADMAGYIFSPASARLQLISLITLIYSWIYT